MATWQRTAEDGLPEVAVVLEDREDGVSVLRLPSGEVREMTAAELVSDGWKRID